jgi:hypothetical protein
MRDQRDRYRTVGHASRIIEQDARHRVVRVADDVPDSVVDELITVERDCCPFFELRWDAAERLLSIAVASGEHEPALEAISCALAGTPTAAT